MPTDSIGETTTAHAALAMTSECILTRKTCTTGALVGFVSRVDFCMSFQIVLTNKALSAAIALELSVAKMCLDMRTDVFSPPEHLATILVHTCPFVGNGILFADVSLNFLWGDASVLKTCINLEIIEECWLLERIIGDGHAMHRHRSFRYENRCLGENHFLFGVLLDLLKERARRLVMGRGSFRRRQRIGGVVRRRLVAQIQVGVLKVESHCTRGRSKVDVGHRAEVHCLCDSIEGIMAGYLCGLLRRSCGSRENVNEDLPAGTIHRLYVLLEVFQLLLCRSF